MLASPIWPGSAGPSGSTSPKPRPSSSTSRTALGPSRRSRTVTVDARACLPDVRDGLLGDAEERPGDLGLEPVVSDLHLARRCRSGAPTPRRSRSTACSNDSSSNACGPRSTISSRRNEMFARVSERALLSASRPPAVSPWSIALLRGRQHQLDTRQLLQRSVVDRLREVAAHARLRVDRAPGQSARPQPGARLRLSQGSDDDRGREATRRRRRPRRHRGARRSSGTSLASVTGISTSGGRTPITRLQPAPWKWA